MNSITKFLFSKRVAFCILALGMSAISLFAQNGLEQAKTMIKSNQLDSAKTLLENLLQANPNDDQILFQLGRVYLGLKNSDQSIRYLEKAVSLKSDSANYHFWLGQSYGIKVMNSSVLKKAGLAKKVKREFEKAVELNPKHIGARIGLTQYYLQAPSFMGGSKEKAYEQIQAIIPARPFTGKMLLAQYFQKIKKDSLADLEYRSLMKQYGDSARYVNLHNTYGYFLLRQKRFNEAVVILEKQTALAPNNANSFDSLGDGYRAANRFEEAAIAYQKALEIDPKFESSKKNLAEMKKQNKK